jgi:hypothetical protein
MGTEYVIYKSDDSDIQLSLYEMSSEVALYVDIKEESTHLGYLSADDLRKLAKEIMKVAYYCDGKQMPEEF